MKSKPHPSQERLHELFEYREDNISQPFLWKIRTAPCVKIGDTVGTVDKTIGYYLIRVNNKVYRLHRLVWIYHNGDIPDEMIVDHIDGDKTNNRIENLRIATQNENMQNSKIRSNNTSGVKGVSWNKQIKKWRARIRICGKEFHVGYFHTKEEAEAAVIAARNNLHGDFSRHE
jgi:hypothetical protein